MKKILLLCLSLITLIIITSCSSYENPNPNYCVEGSKEDVFLCKKNWTSYFDTQIQLTLYVTQTDTFNINEIFSDVDAILETYHQLFDKYHEYGLITNIYSINHRSSSFMTISKELYDALAFVLELEEEITIDGKILFNIALGPVLNIWHDARDNPLCDDTISFAYNVCPVPSASILSVNFPTNPENIVLSSEPYTITFLEENMELDVGGYGKGYVSELITDYLDSLSINYLLNAGNSNVKAGGINPNNDDGYYYIALTRPTIELDFGGNYFAYLKVSANMSVVSSGNHQRFFIGKDDGKVYHHIIDPRTNYPGGEAMSVTVLFENGAIADIYSTSIFLMTLSEGLAFVNAIDGLEAVWYLQDGTIQSSSGFDAFLHQLIE